MNAKWFVRFLSASIMLLLVTTLALASQGVTVNAQATAAATTATAPPPSKMRWDIVSFSSTAGGPPFTLATGGRYTASGNDGSYIT
jgi:hypothetical protein